MDLSGIISPMLTPVTGRDGHVDCEALGKYTERLVDCGIDGLFPCGTTGEFSSLSRDQRRRTVQCVVEHAGEIPVIAGCGSTSLPDTIMYIEDACSAGADAAVVVTPYYLETTQEGQKNYYETVADRSPIPILLYVIPSLTGHRLDPSVVTHLADHNDIIGIKDSSFDLKYHRELIEMTPDTFRVFQGSSCLDVPAFDLGADGATPGVANIFPTAMIALYNGYQNRQHGLVRRISNNIVYPLSSTMDAIPEIPKFKYLASHAGVDLGPPITPLPELTRKEKSSLADLYDQIADGWATIEQDLQG